MKPRGFARKTKKKVGSVETTEAANSNSTPMPKQLPDILTDVQGLATVTEDQFETTLSGIVTDIQALIAAAPTAPAAPAAPTAVSVVITFSDESTQSIPAAQA